ncbi:hypothetical protein TrST_g9372 [Triparma strigata]|uniref:Uncharacterized protein n=1 Tax=Triparma strigata TaxID=1606541 RepID=A0A9W7BTX1_9STRA|nr:hypothetical protein TrST_g9372 [Triparma strigata]
MTVAFIGICKTLNFTTTHVGATKASNSAIMFFSAGLLGLSMMFQDVTAEKIVVVMVIIFFSVHSLLGLLKPNKKLVQVRRLSWECYSELMAHSLLFKGEVDAGAIAPLQYKQIVNSAKHLLNIIQTSREGVKIAGDVELSEALIKKILSISLSAAIVVLRPHFSTLTDKD